MSRIVDDDPPIKTGVTSQAYRDNWERIFGEKEPESRPGCCTPQLCATCGPDCGGRAVVTPEQQAVRDYLAAGGEPSPIGWYGVITGQPHESDCPAPGEPHVTCPEPLDVETHAVAPGEHAPPVLHAVAPAPAAWPPPYYRCGDSSCACSNQLTSAKAESSISKLPRVESCPSNECAVRNTCTGHLNCPRRA